jgi:hypothetical protein
MRKEAQTERKRSARKERIKRWVVAIIFLLMIASMLLADLLALFL